MLKIKGVGCILALKLEVILTRPDMDDNAMIKMVFSNAVRKAKVQVYY